MIWLIILAGLILRLISLNQSLWLDEAISTLAVKNYFLRDLVAQYAKADFHPPGWFIILWFWTKIFGYSEIAVRIPSVIFGILSIWILYLLGKKLLSEKLGIAAALLLAVNPLHIYYSQEARMYGMATLAVLINFLIITKLVKGERFRILYLTASNLFVLSSDYLTYFILPAQFLILWLLKKDTLRIWILSLATACLLGIWWLPVFLGQIGVGTVATNQLPAWKSVVGGFDIKSIPLTIVKFIIGRISLADKFLYGFLLLPICSLFGLLILKGFKSANDNVRKLIAGWIIIPLLLVSVTSLIIPVYNYFRLLFILPGFLLLMAFGILSFKKNLSYLFLIIVLLIELSCTFIYLFNPSFHRENWKGLVNFLSNKKALVLFESTGVFSPFTYYSDSSLNAQGALKNFPARSVQDVIDLAGVNKDIFLVEYLVEISDPQRFVERRLDEIGYKKVATENFVGVGFVNHYVKE